MKFKDTSKLIMAICSSILKDENKTLIVSTDEEKSKITSTRKSGCDNRIEFKNGSTIEFVVSRDILSYQCY